MRASGSSHTRFASPCISEEELSPDEVRLLEAENAELLAEFQTAKDSVKLIETKVVRIAELQVRHILTGPESNKCLEVVWLSVFPLLLTNSA